MSNDCVLRLHSAFIIFNVTVVDQDTGLRSLFLRGQLNVIVDLLFRGELAILSTICCVYSCNIKQKLNLIGIIFKI